jgi:flagellar motor switch protein FliG
MAALPAAPDQTAVATVPGTDLGAPAAGANLSGREKAATLLVSLGPEQAAEVMQHLPAEEIEAISLEMAKLRTVDPAKTNAVLAEFVHTADALELAAEGGVDFAREVLERSLGAEGAADIIARLSATMERRPFEFLRKTPPEQIIAFLNNESPQTIALVIANLHTTLAAQVLSELEPEVQADVAARVASMSEISPDVLQVVERVIKQKLSSVITQEYAASGGVKSLAEILNHTDRPTERNILDRLAETNADLAEQIRLLLFTFEDIVKLNARARAAVLDKAPNDAVVMALRGAAAEIKEAVLQALATRVRRMVEQELSNGQTVPARDIKEAQKAIAGLVLEMAGRGEIDLAADPEAGG